MPAMISAADGESSEKEKALGGISKGFFPVRKLKNTAGI